MDPSPRPVPPTRGVSPQSTGDEPRRQPPFPVVAVGASAGGVEALRDLAAGLPPDFPGCVLIVLHTPATGTSALPAIVRRAGVLPVRHAGEGDRLVPGEILVAPPNHHLIVAGDEVTLSRGPQENGHRPAVDVLCRSLARAQGPNAVAVVLSGSLDDGAAGSVAIARHGGTVLVQDFDEALHSAMPRAAAAAGVEETLLVKDIVARLVEMGQTRAHIPPPWNAGDPELVTAETAMADLDPDGMHDPDRPGTPAGYACPDCNGALFLIDEGGLMRFRCRVGHARSPESLAARQTVSLESALRRALRTLEEKAALHRDMAERAAAGGHDLTAGRFRETTADTTRAAEVLRRLIGQIGGGLPSAGG